MCVTCFCSNCSWTLPDITCTLVKGNDVKIVQPDQQGMFNYHSTLQMLPNLRFTTWNFQQVIISLIHTKRNEVNDDTCVGYPKIITEWQVVVSTCFVDDN
jgi:hypothetical protein